VVQPDPEHPSIANGGFEEIVLAGGAAQDAAHPDDGQRPGQPAGWHYQRQLVVIEAADAPEGTHFVVFSNADPGREAQALQGLAVDGRKVRRLDVSLWVKATNVRQGATPQQQPTLGIVFYDDNRAEAGYAWVWPWRGSFDWQQVRETLQVPLKAREAVLRIGLGGATGEIAMDGTRIQAAD
jgi:protein-L-isoaspartate(D-aspartate) O-methyltransferase